MIAALPTNISANANTSASTLDQRHADIYWRAVN
jgi:hypothetical protein